MTKILSFSNLTLLVALALSTVAAYYSIIGLTAIFAGAVIPVIVMGSILEIGKITATVWLRKYWHRAGLILKFYLVPAVLALALLTSAGIFGFLSKAHMEQGVTSGDVQAKLSLLDEKIKTQRDNIDLSRKALQQMDSQVDQRLSRSDSEQAAERAVTIRRQQAGERAKLQKEIGVAQAEIARLNEERAPIAAENRKVEAEVGPIKYIAALLYGDSADQNMLEAAVRWMIILIVIVFDPLAIALVLAANASRDWDKENLESEPKAVHVADVGEPPTTEEQKNDGVDILPETTSESVEPSSEIPIEKKSDEINEITHPYLYKSAGGFGDLKPMVYKPTIDSIPEPVKQNEIPNAELEVTVDADLKVPHIPYKEVDGGYVVYEGKMTSVDALKEMKPELFKLTTDPTTPSTTKFGTHFPKSAHKGDMFVRVDVLPNRLFKFDGRRWFEVNKDTLDSYLDDSYVQFLIAKIESGEYDIEILSEKERDQIESYLSTKK